jgi:cytochrome bd-type quinol oxidase subunit 2
VLGTVGALLIGLGLRGAIVALAFVLIAVGAIIPPSSEPIIFYASNIPTALVLAPYFFVASAMFLFLRREHYRSDVAVACFAALLLIPSLGSATLSIAAKPFLLSYLALSVGLAMRPTGSIFTRFQSLKR